MNKMHHAKLFNINDFIRKHRSIFIALVISIIGVILLISTSASSPATSLEAESGDPSSNAKPQVVAGASNGQAIKFTAGGGTVGLPAGVTLQEIDGGANYFGKWTNTFPSGENYFWLGVWAETFSDSQDTTNAINKYEAMKINVFPGTWNIGPNTYNLMKSKNMYKISDVAHETFDEPDWRSCAQAGYSVNQQLQEDFPWFTSSCYTLGSNQSDGPVHPNFLNSLHVAIKARDTPSNSKPIFIQGTKYSRVGTDSEDSWVNDDATARKYIENADILSYDNYVMVEAGHYGMPQSWGTPWQQGVLVKNVRRLANYSKPVTPFIETS